eukprot:GHVN01080478.1.p1 GENE.GHVN01080478.1~~GHVN01080478.1.p1  ORF type:complete len:181 (+),score=8.43 GHVN01080478.1:292-834(+)
MDRYRATVLHKTAYYSFYLPLALGMTASGVTEEYAFQYAKEFSVEIGEYFQIQDDYLDCYGDPEVIGKIGTDIEEGKCSWLACKFLDASPPPEDLALFRKHYGVRACAPGTSGSAKDIVKGLYTKYDLPNIFEEFEKSAYKSLTEFVKKIESTKSNGSTNWVQLSKSFSWVMHTTVFRKR